MLYNLAHTIQDKLPWVWDMVEEANAAVFALQKSRRLKALDACCEPGVRLATEADAAALPESEAKDVSDTVHDDDDDGRDNY